MNANVNFSNQFFVNIISDVEMLRTSGHQIGPERFQLVRQSIMNNIDLMVMQNEHDDFVNRHRQQRLNLRLEPVDNRVMSPIGSPRSPPPPPRVEANRNWEQIVRRDEPYQAIVIGPNPEPYFVLPERQRPQQPHWVLPPKKKCIGRARFEARCKDECAICLDTHTNGESVVTQCGHTFGSQCWDTWMSNPTSNRTCPTCRQGRPQITKFTLRADRRDRRERNIIENNDPGFIGIY